MYAREAKGCNCVQKPGCGCWSLVLHAGINMWCKCLCSAVSRSKIHADSVGHDGRHGAWVIMNYHLLLTKAEKGWWTWERSACSRGVGLGGKNCCWGAWSTTGLNLLPLVSQRKGPFDKGGGVEPAIKISCISSWWLCKYLRSQAARPASGAACGVRGHSWDVHFRGCDPAERMGRSRGPGRTLSRLLLGNDVRCFLVQGFL